MNEVVRDEVLFTMSAVTFSVFQNNPLHAY